MPYTIPTVRTPHPNVITLNYPNNIEILISYSTIVAACVNGALLAVDNTTVTTSRHINRWAGYKVRRMPCDEFWTTLRAALGAHE